MFDIKDTKRRVTCPSRKQKQISHRAYCFWYQYYRKQLCGVINSSKHHCQPTLMKKIRCHCAIWNTKLTIWMIWFIASYTYTNVRFRAEQNKLVHILIYSRQEGLVNIGTKIPQNGLHDGASSWFTRVICMWLNSELHIYAVKNANTLYKTGYFGIGVRTADGHS